MRNIKPELVPWFTPEGHLLLEESLVELKQTFERMRDGSDTDSFQLKFILTTCWISLNLSYWVSFANIFFLDLFHNNMIYKRIRLYLLIFINDFAIYCK